MKKEHLVKKLTKELEDSGYSLVIADKIRSCVDIFARKLNKKFTIKVIYNIDSAKRRETTALQKVATFLDAKPIIVGDTSKNGVLSKRVVYNRFSIACIRPDSLEHIETESAYVASKSVGIKAMIDAAQMQYLRRLNDLTINKLAKAAKISPATVYKHERGNAYASLENIEKLENVLNSSIKSNDKDESSHSTDIASKHFANTKMKSITINNAPFDIIARNKNYYEISYETNSRTTTKRAELFHSINETFEDNYPFFVSDYRNGKVKGVPIISKRTLNKMKSEEELLNYLIEIYN